MKEVFGYGIFLDMYNFNEQSAETEIVQKKPAGV